MAMNAKTENVTVSRAALGEVVMCHERAIGHPYKLPVQLYRLKAIVDRPALFAFVQEHGKVCGYHAPEGGLQPSRE